MSGNLSTPPARRKYDSAKRALHLEKLIGDPPAELVGRIAATEEALALLAFNLPQGARDKYLFDLGIVLKKLLDREGLMSGQVHYRRGFERQLRDLSRFV